MVRTVKSRHHEDEEEDDDEEFISRTSDGSSQKEGKRNDQKSSVHRSKHSETEQRRRSKINERFQILRNLIPENDQKRDKASFLLEVIQYVQFLQEKLQMYEGTYQGWSSEPTKLIPWRGNCGVDSFIDQSQLVKNGSIDEDTIVLNPALLTNAQNLVESELSESAVYKETENGAATEAVSLNIPLQPNLFDTVSIQPQGPFPDAERLALQSRPHPWNGSSFLTECAVPSFTPSELKMDGEEASISNAYSKGLLNNLTHALGSSGVDLSQASISVQLDVRKGTRNEVTSTAFGTKDPESISSGNQAMPHCGAGCSGEDCDRGHKRLRTEHS